VKARANWGFLRARKPVENVGRERTGGGRAAEIQHSLAEFRFTSRALYHLQEDASLSAAVRSASTNKAKAADDWRRLG
jgi:hypothetical protein